MLKVTRGLDQTLSVKLPFAGEHNGRNALAAIGVAKALGVSAENMKRGLETATNIGGRLARREISQHIHVIDDSYNANPASVMAGLQVLVEESNNKILVLGDMAELGDHSDDLHRSLLEAIERSPVDEVLTLGPRLKRAAGALAGRTQAFLELDELVERLRKTPVRATTILVKGAHSMAMHRVIERVEAMHGGKN
jgi:UDP-N-acetylmuramoyl-tripeptide--D-alanyl-D-alanine ligase